MAIRFLVRPSVYSLITFTTATIPSLQIPKPPAFSTSPKPQIPRPPDFSQKTYHMNVVSLSNLFQRYRFPPCKLHTFLTRNRFLLNSHSADIEKSLKILISLKPCQDFLHSVVNNCPRVLELEFLKKWEMGISEMGASHVSWITIQNVLEVSRKFDLDPNDFYRCLQCLKGLRLSDSAVNRVLETFPMVIMMSGDQIRDRIEFLVGIGIQRNEIDRIFQWFPGILAYSMENKLKPLFSEFEDLGFSTDVVRKEILRDPRILGLEVGELSKCLRMLRSLKCRVAIDEKIFRQGVFRAGYEVKLRVDVLHKYGLTYRDAFTILWKEPRVMLYQIEDIKKKIEFLINRMKFDVLCLVEVPEYLGVNFEKQIVPRYSAIEYLRSKGGLGDEVGLKALIKCSRMRFYNLYVKPYPECEKIYGRFAGDVEVKNRHPVGMWKLFKPQKYRESKEDVQNIKCFMETLV
ncbi:unnamed protein product [Ilex paraguariensis]|uniref:Transcription termination factor MTERF15, mitochondrial n=1 Tax=Ilex paraguariensis TaxID=185542 RepID=A0ABC8UKM0_9AQUA